MRFPRKKKNNKQKKNLKLRKRQVSIHIVA
jgi:hypothetical protein